MVDQIIEQYMGFTIYLDPVQHIYYWFMVDGTKRMTGSLALAKGEVDYYLANTDIFGLEPPIDEVDPAINLGEPDYIDYQYNDVDVWFAPDMNYWYVIDNDDQKWVFHGLPDLEAYVNANIDSFKDVYNLGEEGYFVKYFYVGSVKYDIYFNNVKGYYCPSKKDNNGVPYYFNTQADLENYLKGLISPFPSEQVIQPQNYEYGIMDVFSRLFSMFVNFIENNPDRQFTRGVLDFIGKQLAGLTGSQADYNAAIALQNSLYEDLTNGIVSLIFSRAVFGTVSKTFNVNTGQWETVKTGGLNIDFGSQLAAFRTLNNMYFGTVNMLQGMNNQYDVGTDVDLGTLGVVRPHVEGYWQYSKLGGPYGSGWIKSRYGAYFIRKNR